MELFHQNAFKKNWNRGQIPFKELIKFDKKQDNPKKKKKAQKQDNPKKKSGQI